MHVFPTSAFNVGNGHEQINYYIKCMIFHRLQAMLHGLFKINQIPMLDNRPLDKDVECVQYSSLDNSYIFVFNTDIICMCYCIIVIKCVKCIFESHMID